jgi:hypothetical protein
MHHHAPIPRNAARLVTASIGMEAQAARIRIKTAQHNGAETGRTTLIQARNSWRMQRAAPIRHGIGQQPKGFL